MKPARRHRSSNGSLASIEREALPLLVLAFYAALLAFLARSEIVGDSWLTLAAGREVADHGIPHHDHLMVLSHGVRWTDQQWLAQLGFYTLGQAGGLRLAFVLHWLLLVGAVGLAIAAARWRGAAPKVVFWVTLPCLFLAPWAWQLRAQSFAYPLYVGSLWLLVADSRKPTRRVLLLLPLLVLWANLHGSVVLGVLLCVLRGVTILWERLRHRPSRDWRLRAGFLLASPVTLILSPYGLQLVGYYHHMLGSSVLSDFVQEWGPTTPQKTWFFYPIALASVWLLGRNAKTLSPFEGMALLATIGLGFVALRHIVWFELTALVLLPALISARLDSNAKSVRLRGAGRTAQLALIALGVTAVVSLLHSNRWYQQQTPLRASAEIARATQANRTRVFASETVADWLLWRYPSLRGRIAYDVRFEILTTRQLKSLLAYHRRSGSDWQAPTRAYDVFVFDRLRDEALAQAIQRDPGIRVDYADAHFLVIDRLKAARGSAVGAVGGRRGSSTRS